MFVKAFVGAKTGHSDIDTWQRRPVIRIGPLESRFEQDVLRELYDIDIVVVGFRLGHFRRSRTALPAPDIVETTLKQPASTPEANKTRSPLFPEVRALSDEELELQVNRGRASALQGEPYDIAKAELALRKNAKRILEGRQVRSRGTDCKIGMGVMRDCVQTICR